ncbi:type III-A CRISPR-associated RAMP protein Csm4 [Tumebacillus flagellatus]|uniref:CRISPR system Cms protein Csm4 n=1 Tax=Tumebacillus flagellatus TaxID=1157490 RepID=A0A074M9G3_9BACL|nr:hypothetical protein [Tumebacillus flagellatus]KEO82572.1 hypothetical protein EL26_14395 [Tumebacillus flagellatus]
MIIEYRLHFNSPLLGQLDSDTLMGAMAWAMVRTEGVPALQEWIQRCLDDDPPFVVSNGFPTGYFPKPMLLPLKRTESADKSSQLQVARENKRFKNRRWVTNDEFHQLLQGQPLTNHSVVEPSSYSGTHVHAVIDRTTGKSLSEHGLYEIHFSGYLAVSLYFRLLDLNWAQKVDNLLRFLEMEGIGARKSTGHGQFKILSHQEYVLPEIQESNGYVVLSTFVPSIRDSQVGRYRVKTKYGKVAEEYSQQGVPFKKPLLMIESGASFHDSTPRTYCGRIVTGITPQRPEVVQFGYGLTVPAQLALVERDLTK